MKNVYIIFLMLFSSLIIFCSKPPRVKPWKNHKRMKPLLEKLLSQSIKQHALLGLESYSEQEALNIVMNFKSSKEFIELESANPGASNLIDGVIRKIQG